MKLFRKNFSRALEIMKYMVMLLAIIAADCAVAWSMTWGYSHASTGGSCKGLVITTFIISALVMLGYTMSLYEVKAEKWINIQIKNQVIRNIVKIIGTMLIAAAIILVVFLVYGTICLLKRGWKHLCQMLPMVMENGLWANVVLVGHGLAIALLTFFIFAVIMGLAMTIADKKQNTGRRDQN